jgi:4-amino-4-deoxy-L-arabinose transferase-like glycosyltransferase
MNRLSFLSWKPSLVAIAAIILLTFLARWPDLAMPLERDEGEYAYAAQEIERGDMPYRDSFCQKPPVVFFWYLAGFKVFGETTQGVHLTLVVAAALGAFGLFLLVEHFLGCGAGLLASAVYALNSAGYGYFGSAANTEIFMLVPVIFGCFVFVRAGESGGWFRWSAAGAILALSVLTKQVALFSFIGPCSYAGWLTYRRSGWRELATGTIYAAAGVILATLPIMLWLDRGQALGPFLEAAYFHNLDYVSSPFAPAKWMRIVAVIGERFLVSDGLLWLLMLAGVGMLIVKGWRIPALVFASLWFVTSLVGVALGPYSFGHYFLQVLPPLAMIAAAIWSLSSRSARAITSLAVKSQRPTGQQKIIAVLFAAILLVLPVAARMPMLARPVNDRCVELYRVYGPVPFAIAPELSERLASTMKEEDKILIIGSEPEILFYARCQSTTRYTIFYPLTGNYPDADKQAAVMFGECTADPPAKIIVCYSPSSFIGFGPTNEKLARIFRSIAALVNGRYQEEMTVWMDQTTGQCHIYEPTSGSAGSTRGYRLLQVFSKI